MNNPTQTTPISHANVKTPVPDTSNSAPDSTIVDPSPESEQSESSIGPGSSAADLVDWGLVQFSDQPIVLTSSFGMEGCALMDMCSQSIQKQGLENLTIASIDTGFLFPETKQLRDRLVERYPNLDFVTWQTPVSIQQQRETYGDELWKNNPNMCCHIRKIQPMRENISKYRLWMTALRRSQTEQRADTEVVQWDWQYQLLKFCPIATWSRGDVWKYIQDHDVPFNQLHLQNYPSVSCFHCTRPVPGSSPDSDARQGRWQGTEKNECGLHFSI